jgi:hypothetical protein
MNIIQEIVQLLGFAGMLTVTQIGVTVFVFAIVLRFGPPILTRNRSLMIGFGWVLLVTVEYWIAGPYSFVFGATDILLSLPFYSFLNQWHDGGMFSHAFNGGMDLSATMANAGQFISFEKWLARVEPMWVANMIQKILAVGLGFWGVYLLARRVAGTDRDLALGLAALYPLSQNLMIHHSWFHGMGYAVIPLAVYLCVFRYGKRYYYSGLILISAFHAISSTQPLSGMAFFPAMALAALLADSRRMLRMAHAIILPALFVIANWHESLFAKALIGPLTLRGKDYNWVATDIEKIFSNLSYDITHEWEVPAIAMIGLVLFWATRSRKLIVAMLVVCMALWTGVVLNQFPWGDIGAASLAGVNFRYTNYSARTIGLLVAAIAIGGINKRSLAGVHTMLAWSQFVKIRTFVVAIVIALAIGKFAWYKAVNIPVWLSEGGLPVLTENMKRLQNRPWAPKEPFRVVTIPYRLSPNMAPAVGLDSFDATSQLILGSAAKYWMKAIIRGTVVGVDGGFMIFDPIEFDIKCCASYDISKHMNLEFLRIVNVGYILSTLPLYGDNLVKVSGPLEDIAPPRNKLPFKERISAYIDAIIDPSPIYVYAIGKALPRIYVAQGLIKVASDISDASFLDLIRQHAPARRAVIKNAADNAATVSADNLKITNYELVSDGFNVNLKGSTAGSVIINGSYMPFWKAYADGKAVKIASANMVHMIISVPPNTKSLKVRYERPLLIDKVKKQLFGKITK